MALVKTKVKETWVMCAVLCILLMTIPSVFAAKKEGMYLSLLQLCSYHHGLICAWLTMVGTIWEEIKGGECRHEECMRKYRDELHKWNEAASLLTVCVSGVIPQECCCAFYKDVPPTLANNIGRTVVVGDDGFLGH
jgi:hypothetical protein